MRLGLLGPADGDLAGLARSAEFLLNSAKVTRAIYLGADDALEETVAIWAESLVGPDATDHGIWSRALDAAASGSADKIDAFLRGERARVRLKALECLPPAELRSVEMFGDRVAVLIYEKALLDEEDIFSATFLLYGKSDGPLMKRIGPRWFVTPGPIGCSAGGSLVLDDSGEQVIATVYDLDGKDTHTETLTAQRATRVSVQG